MMKKLKQLVVTATLVLGVGVAVLPAGTVLAVNPFGACSGQSGSSVCAAQNDDASKMVKNIINILLYAIGIVAVIVIIIGGFMYTTSAGDTGRIKTAKDTIFYAVIGLVVALLAFAIVNFVLAQF